MQDDNSTDSASSTERQVTNNNVHKEKSSFTNLLETLSRDSYNSTYFLEKRREYEEYSRARLTSSIDLHNDNKRKWDSLAIMDRDLKRRKLELDSLNLAIMQLKEERKYKEIQYNTTSEYIENLISDLLDNVKAEEDGGLRAFSKKTRECIICSEIKLEKDFVYNLTCSHSHCINCMRISRSNGVKTCMVCRTKLSDNCFISIIESNGCRFVKRKI